MSGEFFRKGWSRQNSNRMRFTQKPIFFTISTLQHELDEIAMKLTPRLKETDPMTLKTTNNTKNPRQRRQFDPLSRADQNECFCETVSKL